MFSFRFLGIFLTKFMAKMLIVTTLLAFLTLYPVWTAMATGGLIYLAVVNIISVEVALAGTALMSFAQSVWLMKLRYDNYASN